ncbi:MAG: bifunctional folylpolyglutamate synthase/dihydrofolate synthase [Deltaproteobacteria bacterium]|jgi:dihydrofolate synthase/folylpolyglutamate synthase|nr:bifunctional folylpolyglutamate synthase/dihydrofolate synthase [Deltaproteobacteria bacterium]
MAAHFSSFAGLSAHLETLGLFRMRPELGRFRAVLASLGMEEPRAGAAIPAVQIAGTNGKGSTSTFLASLAEAHGKKAGLFTSPHFVSFRERIRLNGVPAAEDLLLEPANRIMAAGGKALTYFEFVTALGMLVLERESVDIAVLETGLGGTWDAVTALPVDCVAFTPIGLDHCRILGNTVAAIAGDKAGAIRPGKPVFSAAQPEDALRALRRAALSAKSPLVLAPPTEEGTPLGLAGNHQRTNAGLALAVWRHMAEERGWPSSGAREAAGLAGAFIPGRLQSVPPSPAHGHPALLLDGAHNGHGMAALGEALAAQGIAPAAVIFSCLEDKVPEAMAAHLRTLAGGPVFVPPISGNPRALPPETLASAIGLAATPVSSMGEALERAALHIATRLPEEAAAHPERHPALICGSLYMLGDFFALRPDCLGNPPKAWRKPDNGLAKA